MMVLGFYRLLGRVVYPLIWRRRLDQGKIAAERAEEYRGVYSQKRPEGKLLWFHGASVGECLSVLALIKAVHQHYPSWNIILTSGTRSSTEVVNKYFTDYFVHVHAPLDHPDWVERFYDHWHPDVACWIESEWWPVLLSQADARGVERILLNGQMSQRSFQYYSWLPTLSRRLLGGFREILVQNQQQLGYFHILGGEHARIAANLKDAAEPLIDDKALSNQWQQALDQRQFWLAASTHPGEEEIIIQAQAILQQQYPQALCLLMPRHPERCPDIADKITQNTDLSMSMGIHPVNEIGNIHIIDALGLLGVFYRLVSVAFVGGSLVPIGGHNLREAALLHCGLISGAYLQKFAEQQRVFAPVLRIVKDSKELAAAVRPYWSEQEYAENIGRQAHDIAAGTALPAIQANMAVLEPILQQAEYT